jgi:tRNA(adenine34) deaminase
MTDRHIDYMHKAVSLAQMALDKDEFPVGCLLTYKDQIIASGVRTGTNQQVPSELDHAEMIALRELEKQAARLPRDRMTLYSTLEPCLMCYGAILLSGIGTLVYAYEDAMGGGTSCDRSSLPSLYRNNGMRIIKGVCRSESLSLFKTYFSRPGIDYWRDSLLATYTMNQPVSVSP